MRRTITLLMGVAVGAAALVGVPSGPASSQRTTAPTQVVAPVPIIVWKPCDGETADRPLCAVAKVPLDYDDPTGPTTPIHLLKIPAGKPSERIGTLFVNPGGPGSTAGDFAAYFGNLVAPSVANRFDIVGIDPRGTASPMMRCDSDETRPRGTGVPFPVTAKEAQTWIDLDGWVRRACRTAPAPITAHMSTADTARDMDLVRQALGESRLSYYGISYGSYLGATYAAMFPSRVRAMVIDGVLDPVAWANGRNGTGATLPFSTRLKSGAGAAEALTSALAKCNQVGRRHCALAPHARRKWDVIVQRLRRGPLRFEGRRFTYPDLVSDTLGYLYGADSYPSLMAGLAHLHDRVVSRNARVGTPVLPRLPSDPRGIAGPYSFHGPGLYPIRRTGFGTVANPFVGVACADTDNPKDPWAWWRAARAFEKSQPWFSALWTWVSSPCANWPARLKEDAFHGPFHVVTASPVLVIGNSHDPATPISGARAANSLLTGSRLLELRTWGHGAIGDGSCVIRRTRDYLVWLRLPPVGAVCLPAHPLFR